MILRAGFGVPAVAVLLLAGCSLWRREEPVVQSMPAREIVPVSGATSTPAMVAPTIVATEPVAEPVVDLEMADAPVKLILQRLADIGGLQLILPPNLNRTLSVQYIRVPVSMALDDVLKRAGLRLGAGPAPNLPFDTVTVFYQLPANVDSLSADAIMRRFGVSRAVADLIVKSRRP